LLLCYSLIELIAKYHNDFMYRFKLPTIRYTHSYLYIHDPGSSLVYRRTACTVYRKTGARSYRKQN